MTHGEAPGASPAAGCTFPSSVVWKVSSVKKGIVPYVLSLCAPSVLARGFPQERPTCECFGADIEGSDLIFRSKTSNV